MHYAGKLNLRSHNSSYCLIKVVIKAGLTACIKYHTNVVLKPETCWIVNVLFTEVDCYTILRPLVSNLIFQSA